MLPPTPLTVPDVQISRIRRESFAHSGVAMDDPGRRKMKTPDPCDLMAYQLSRRKFPDMS